MRRRGFRLGRRLVRVFRWVFRSKRRSCTSYQRLDDFSSSSSCSRRSYRTKTMTKIYSWGQYLKRGAKELCCAGYSRPAPLDYCRLGGGGGSGTGSGGRPFYEELKPVEVPKGHLAVYVGKKDDDPQPHRVLVPIIYFNHPLFGELLREAEKEFGYNHPGGITLPCPISEFEKVKTEIAAGRKSSTSTTMTRRHQDRR